MLPSRPLSPPWSAEWHHPWTNSRFAQPQCAGPRFLTGLPKPPTTPTSQMREIYLEAGVNLGVDEVSTTMFQTKIEIETHGEGEIVNLTPRIEQAITESGVQEGLANIFVVGSTAAITTIEYEPGVLSDLRRALAVIAPADIPYAHDRAWGDGNGRSHVRAAVLGPSLSVPVIGGSLGCGTWQQVVLVELDVRSSRQRTVYLTVLGSTTSR